MFKNYYKYSLLVFLLLFLFLNSGSFVFAGGASGSWGNNLEAKYPPVLGFTVAASGPGSRLEDYVAYFFAVAIAIAGLLAAVFIVIGGIKLAMSSGNASLRKDATDTIKGAVLGLILIISSFLLLKTINTSLVTESLTPLPESNGIFYKKTDTDLKPAPMEEANTDNIPADYNSVFYKCASGPDLFVWQFPQANFQGIDDAFVSTLKCGDSADIRGAGSLKMAYKTPGIYYFLKDNCQGYMSDANTSSGTLSAPFKDNVKSINIVSDTTNNIYYGYIFHGTDDPTRAGFCSLANHSDDLTKSDECYGNSPVSSSADIFVWNAKTPQTSGNGVHFQSEPWGTSVGARSGYLWVNNQSEDNSYWNSLTLKTTNITFNYAGIDRTDTYKQLYQNFFQHPGSIYLEGKYLLILWGPTSGQNEYCQTFNKTIPNLNETEFIATGNKIDTVSIYPTK